MSYNVFFKASIFFSVSSFSINTASMHDSFASFSINGPIILSCILYVFDEATGRSSKDKYLLVWVIPPPACREATKIIIIMK